MEVPGVDEVKKGESHVTSASAFVEGGIQEAYDDACSICLEAFCDSNPSSVTSCKHEFHLQCILEWCQRSSNCPMCWQPISLKDPNSQELLEAVEMEKRNEAIFRPPTLGDFELQHLPMGAGNSVVEECIVQHLAASMGRNHRISQRDGSRNRSSLFSSGRDQVSSSSSGSLTMPNSYQELCNDNRSFISQFSLPNQDRAGPSEFQSFSDSWKSRFSAVSMKYKESISKSTKGWKEKMLSRSPSIADIGSEVRREVHAGIATVSRLMERLEARDTSKPGLVLSENNRVNSSGSELRERGGNRDQTA